MSRDIYTRNEHSVKVLARPTERLDVRFSADIFDLDLNGEFVFGNVLRTGDWEIDTTSYRAGVQYIATEELSLSGGLLFESRDALFLWTEGEAASNTEDVTTDSSGYFGLVSWHPAAELAYRTLDYDEADFDFDDYDADIVELSIGYRW